MLKYLLRRVLQSIVTLFIVITVVFILLRQMPIDGYFTNIDKMNDAQIEASLDKMGLNDPLIIQLKDFYIDLLHGDLGVSNRIQQNVPITEILKEKAPYSIAFGLAAIAISLILGIPLGIFMARSQGKFGDKIGTGLVVFITAVPSAIYFIYMQTYLTKALGFPFLFDKYNPSSWILPAVSMALPSLANYAIWMRRYMLDEANKDYVKLATAKGFSNKEVMSKQVFRNAFVPMIQFIPTSILLTIVGSIYIESLYSIPGMGGLLVDAIQRQDNTVVQALVLVFSALSIIGLLVGDLLMVLIDPRIKLEKGEEGR